MTPNMLFWILSYLALALFIGAWFLFCRSKCNKAGMTQDLNGETGILLRSSPCSGTVNGIRFRSGLRVVEYERGWAVLSFFGGGKLWLPKDKARVSELRKREGLIPKYCTIRSGDDRVNLSGARQSSSTKTGLLQRHNQTKPLVWRCPVVGNQKAALLSGKMLKDKWN